MLSTLSKLGQVTVILWVLSATLVVAASSAWAGDNALKLNKRGWMDTDVSMSEFANGPHTVSAWMMPEFVNAVPGDVFASTSNPQYSVGLGDYRSGNGGFKTNGDPVLTMTIGNKTVMYLAPSLSKRTWHHFVIRRTPANADGVATFQLFVDGNRLIPSVVTKNDANIQVSPGSEIAFSPADPLPTFSGMLRVGPHGGSLDYFYGLVDNVNVHSRTLTAAEILAIANGSLPVPTDNLVARYAFDVPILDPAPYAQRTFTLNDSKWVYVVERISTASKTADAAIFDMPDYVAPTEATYRLPVTVNEVWYVVQGCDNPAGSHNGYAAFSFDLRRADKQIGSVRAAADGTAYWMADGVSDGTNPPREGNWLRTRVAPHESLTYLHFETNSLTGTFQLLFQPTPTTPEFWFQVNEGQPLGNYGDAALHLHINGTNEYSSDAAKWRGMAIAFTDYYVATSASGPWTYVVRGQPKAGQYIKHLTPAREPTKSPIEVAIDPWALIFKGMALLRLYELHHPHEPKVAEIQQVLRSMTPEEQKATLNRARTLANYGKAVEEAFATMK